MPYSLTGSGQVPGDARFGRASKLAEEEQHKSTGQMFSLSL